MLSKSIKKYRKQIKRALEDEYLRRTLDSFALSYKQSRKNAFDGLDFDSLRSELSSIRQSACAGLWELYAQFKKRAEEAGAVVHFARTADEANRIILQIARDRGVRKIVKSKSMTAEEIFLNDYLKGNGLDVVETDLGEWIIQLCGHRPSHMVMPAIHLSRKNVADIFRNSLGEVVSSDDISEMVLLARRRLRREFLEAHMGISGANFAIAETGTIGIVTNEGNGRLVTTLPRVHVVLLGIEKLVPDTETALKILRVLPKNATGQTISTYVSWIRGSVQWKGLDGDSRKIYHIVFLDNGRSSLAKDPVFSDVLKCIRCGACANVCPVYRLIGGHNLGYIYIGAIGLLLTYFYHGRDKAEAIVRNCLNCQACKEVCPVGIDLPSLLKFLYERMLQEGSVKPLKNILLKYVMRNRNLFHSIIKRMSALRKPLVDSDGIIRHLPLYFMKEHSFRSLPSIAEVPFRDRVRDESRGEKKASMHIGFFAGCLIDFVYPEQGEAAMDIFRSIGAKVYFPKGQSCCGLPAFMMGELGLARELAYQNIYAFKKYKHLNCVVSLCASCVSHMKKGYIQLLDSEDSMWFSEKVVDFPSFLKDLGLNLSEFFDGGQASVTYHNPCHLCRGLGVYDAPRDIIIRAGYEFIPCDEEDVCCGFGGSYSLEFPEVSRELLKNKLRDIEKTGASIVVTDCPGCILQLRGGFDKAGSSVEVLHTVELLRRVLKSTF